MAWSEFSSNRTRLSVLQAVCMTVLTVAHCGAQEPVMTSDAARRILIVLGAEGEPQYGEAFRTWGQRWQAAQGASELRLIDGTATAIDTDTIIDTDTTNNTEREGTSSDRDALLQWISEASEEGKEHWLILIGHGTQDRKDASFNLRGPDISATELAAALAQRPGKWVIIVCSSCSAPFLKSISGPDRIIITATKTGAEENFSRFGDFLSMAISDQTADLDHDASVSVLEAFLAASQGVAKYYEERGLLATEQALLDDNGDGRGTPGVFYRGIRAIKAPAEGASLDGPVASRTIWQSNSDSPLPPDRLAEIEIIEQRIEDIRGRKGTFEEDEYYSQLERLLLKIARLRGLIQN